MKRIKKRRIEKKLISPDHKAIKELRLEAGLTLKEAGKSLNISEKTIGAIENGRISLSKPRINEIINCYGFTYFDFVRVKKLHDKSENKRLPRKTIKTVLKNSDRRSYQKIITKECKVLRSMRRIKKISQDEASKLCGYSRPTIGHIENGRIDLNTERVKHIIESYGYKYSDFEESLGKAELRDVIIDSCLLKIWALDDAKLILLKGLLESL